VAIDGDDVTKLLIADISAIMASRAGYVGQNNQANSLGFDRLTKEFLFYCFRLVPQNGKIKFVFHRRERKLTVLRDPSSIPAKNFYAYQETKQEGNS
jgi:hypothetical protein